MAKYGIYNTSRKQFQFGISEDTPEGAMKALFNKIGKDAYRWRFEARKIPEDNKPSEKGVMMIAYEVRVTIITHVPEDISEEDIIATHEAILADANINYDRVEIIP